MADCSDLMKALSKMPDNKTCADCDDRVSAFSDNIDFRISTSFHVDAWLMQHGGESESERRCVSPGVTLTAGSKDERGVAYWAGESHVASEAILGRKKEDGVYYNLAPHHPTSLVLRTLHWDCPHGCVMWDTRTPPPGRCVGHGPCHNHNPNSRSPSRPRPRSHRTVSSNDPDPAAG